MILAIDTVDVARTNLFLLNENFNIVARSEYESANNLSERLLKNIDLFLSQNSISKKELVGIFVDRGPGSYTGLRISISVANFIAFSNNLPIIGYSGDITDNVVMSELEKEFVGQAGKFGNFVTPLYKMPPNITKNKSCLG